MKRFVLYLLTVLVALSTKSTAQISWFPNIGSGAPTGNCGQSQIYQDWANGNLYSCKVVGGAGTWQLVGSSGGVTANPTVGVIPYLSAANTYSDSPLTRAGASSVQLPGGSTIKEGTGSTLLLISGGSAIGIGADQPGPFPISIAQSSLGLSFGGMVTSYDQQSTAGWGFATVYGVFSGAEADQTSSLSDTTIANSSVGSASLWRVSVNVISNGTCSIPGPAGVTVGLKWQDIAGSKSVSSLPLDVNGSATLVGSVPLGDTTSWGTGSAAIKLVAGGQIKLNTTLTGCTTGTATYRIDVAAERLR